MIKIVGMMVVGPGEADRFLKQVLDRIEGLVDKLVVWGCYADTKTESLLLSYPFVEYHSDASHPWAEYQPQIKYTLLTRHVFPHKPDWIISLDADEVFDKRITREILEEMAGRGELAFNFYCVQLYDREDQMRVDGLWGGFRNVRFWKPLYEVPQTWLPAKLHCGLAPMYAYAYAADSEFLFKHYGYLRAADREKKKERYDKHDPRGAYMNTWYYKSILDEQPILREFDEDEFGKSLAYLAKRPKIEKVVTNFSKKMAEVVYFQNPHGQVVSSSDPSIIEQWSKNPKLKKLYTSDSTPIKNEAPVIVKSELSCNICGFTAKSEQGLRVHTYSKHK